MDIFFGTDQSLLSNQFLFCVNLTMQLSLGIINFFVQWNCLN